MVEKLQSRLTIVMVVPPIHIVPPAKGAAVEWWVFQVCRQLSRDYDCHVICTHEPGIPEYEIIDGVHLHRVRIGALYKRIFQKWTRLDPCSYAYRAAQLITRLHADIVHVHNSPQLMEEIAQYCEKARGHKGQWVLHMHNEKKLGELPTGTIFLTPSKSLMHFYQEQLPARVATHVVANGVDVESAQCAVVDMRVPVFSHGRKVLLFAGRVSPEKGLLQLVHALDALCYRDDWCLVIAGEFSHGNRDIRRVVYGQQVRQALALWEQDRVLVLGALAPEAMSAVYRAVDLVLVPSQFEEPFCMVAIEAMACSRLVMASRNGGMVEYMRDGENAIQVGNFSDVEAWRQAISAWLDGDSCQNIAERGRCLVERHFTWSNVARELADVYRGWSGRSK